MTDSHSNSPVQLPLQWLPDRFAVARLEPDAPIPQWADRRLPLISITRTADELSIVGPEDFVPLTVRAERDFIAVRVAGTLDFSSVGILARLTGALADADVSVLAISTFNTDYLLVRKRDKQSAQAALSAVSGVRWL